MKCATPASAAVSRRDPASTYAATETERAPGRRAVMTRGPSGSSVRWNIAGDGSPDANTGGRTRPATIATERRPEGDAASPMRTVTQPMMAAALTTTCGGRDAAFVQRGRVARRRRIE